MYTEYKILHELTHHEDHLKANWVFVQAETNFGGTTAVLSTQEAFPPEMQIHQIMKVMKSKHSQNLITYLQSEGKL
jgi:hypothetical protein